MITKGIEEAVEATLEDVFDAGVYAAEAKRDVVAAKRQDILELIKIEAVNLVDQIIGPDVILHSSTDEDGVETLDPADKAVFDFQVLQRLDLAGYQNPIPAERGKPTGPEDLIDDDLSPNEA